MRPSRYLLFLSSYQLRDLTQTVGGICGYNFCNHLWMENICTGSPDLQFWTSCHPNVQRFSHVSWKAAKTNSMPLGTTRDLAKRQLPARLGWKQLVLEQILLTSPGTTEQRPKPAFQTKFTKWRVESVARGQTISLSNSNTLSLWDLKRAQPIIPVVPACVMQGYTGYTEKLGMYRNTDSNSVRIPVIHTVLYW